MIYLYGIAPWDIWHLTHDSADSYPVCIGTCHLHKAVGLIKYKEKSELRENMFEEYIDYKKSVTATNEHLDWKYKSKDVWNNYQEKIHNFK